MAATCHAAASGFGCLNARSTRRRVFLLPNKDTRLPVQLENASSCPTTTFRKTRRLAQQEDASSCSPKRHAFLFNKNLNSMTVGQCACTKMMQEMLPKLGSGSNPCQRKLGQIKPKGSRSPGSCQEHDFLPTGQTRCLVLEIVTTKKI